MRVHILGLVIVAFLGLAACRNNAPIEPTKTTPTVTASATILPSRTATPTKPPTVTHTATPTRTSFPTITPTFDPASIVTVTPAPAAQCPTENSEVSLALTFKDIMQGDPALTILDFLNAGGSQGQLEKQILALKAQLPSSDMGLDGKIQSLDLTNDGVPELLIELISFDHVSNLGESYSAQLFVCRDAQYQFEQLAFYQLSEGSAFITLADLNQNGIPEIVLENYLPDRFLEVQVLEWGGAGFGNLVDGGMTIEQEEGSLEMEDFDGNGLLDLIVIGRTGPNLNYASFMLARLYTSVWAWNGQWFRLISQRAQQPPTYQIQAIDDGDLALRQEDYAQAVLAYTQAITDETLLGWHAQWSEFLVFDSNLLSVPEADPQERPRLEAYAHYRLILLFAAQNQLSLAEAEYKILSENFGENSENHIYTQLAGAFWETFVTTKELYVSCQNAITFARQNSSQIIAPLGEEFYGPARPRLTPEDICPFK